MGEKKKHFVGVDWATENHRVCVEDEAGQIVGKRTVSHSGKGLDELCHWLDEISGGERGAVAVGIEIPHGAVVETLLERGFDVYALNPKQLDRFRDRFSVAGVKDDDLDAHVLADSLRTDSGLYRKLHLQEAKIIELREWSRMTEELKKEKTQLSNRMQHQLLRYYPQALKLTDDVGAPWFLELWVKVPTPAMARRIHVGTVAKLLKKRRVRRINAQQVVSILREQPVWVAPGTTEAACAHIKQLVARLHLIHEQLGECHMRLEAMLAGLSDDTDEEQVDENSNEQRDATIIRSLPGVGIIVLATLLSEAYDLIQERNYSRLRSLCGVAPVTKRSGKSCVVMMRRACHPRLREALYHWARVAMQHDHVNRRRYVELRRRGHNHNRALRTLGDRLLYVMCAMLKNGTTFDPAQPRAYEKKRAA